MSRCWALTLRCGKFVVELLWARPLVVCVGGVVQHVRSWCPCSGVWALCFVCALSVVSDDSAETPGRCIRAKNLTPCSTNADCTDVDESCSSLNDAQGQTYCLPTSNDNADDLQQLLGAGVPGKHQAYSKQLAEYGTSCRTWLFVILGCFLFVELFVFICDSYKERDAALWFTLTRVTRIRDNISWRWFHEGRLCVRLSVCPVGFSNSRGVVDIFEWWGA